MSITANTPQPKKPPEKKQGRNYLSWIIFLFILIRPLWGVLRSIAPPTISSQQIIMLVAGVVVVGVVAIVALRARDSRPSTQSPYTLPQTSSRTPSPYTQTQSTPSPYTQTRTSSGVPRSMSSGVPRAPQFEPIITGNVVLAGIVLAALIGGVIVLVTITMP